MNQMVEEDPRPTFAPGKQGVEERALFDAITKAGFSEQQIWIIKKFCHGLQKQVENHALTQIIGQGWFPDRQATEAESRKAKLIARAVQEEYDLFFAPGVKVSCWGFGCERAEGDEEIRTR